MYFNIEDLPDALKTLIQLHNDRLESIGNFFMEIYPAKVRNDLHRGSNHLLVHRSLNFG